MNEALIAFDTFQSPMLVQLDPADTVPLVVPPVTPDIQANGASFARLMSVQEPSGQLLPGVQFATPVSAVPQDPTKNLGNAIVSVADNVGSDYKQNISRIYKALDRDVLSPGELMRLQLDLTIVSLEVDVVGKGVQKSVQHVDTLVNLK